ncbi:MULTISPECIES: NADH-dependent flavin oxidoreductase [unclassified Streptococcus]|uniref:NADH-dependent flavin oxidoreductase n=1 Tax=unclassified Streptococcus TaxID=2608887 RepID=UPI0007355025|nr:MULTISPECIES: NADH-dependent flavin oxidoreductase [unclassified Streptococcus]OFN56202.1 NADH-dependent oxidoreductase [Streptococcus sp. HMSC034B05]PNM83681.1 NADH-dependent oxidoreductase [Streptococcus sp. FDAARGOS_146]
MSKSLIDTVQFRHGAQLSSRLVMPPMLTFSGLKGGFVSDDTLRYYHARSQAAGLLIAEYHYVSESGGPCSRPGYPEQLGIYSDEHLEGAKKIAAALQKNGNKAILQIHHGGREASGRAVKGEEVLAPSALDFSFLSYPVREMTNAEIEGIIKDFGRATKRAIEAGFSGVEIHGANHYLLQQFFSSFSNVREDKWGSSLEKRMAFPLAVVKEVKRVVGKYAPKDFIVGYRISPEEIHGDEVGYSYREAQALIREVIKYELDYIHLSLWEGYASKPVGSDRTYAEHFKSILDNQTKLIIVGGVFSEEDAQDAIAQTPTDLIAVGRGTLIDPLFGQKIKEGRGDEIVHQISPEQLEQTAWTSGLREAFTREDSLGLPELPGHDSITEIHTGKYDSAEK